MSEDNLELLIGHGRHPATVLPLGKLYRRYPSTAEPVERRVLALDPTLSDAERAEAMGRHWA